MDSQTYERLLHPRPRDHGFDAALGDSRGPRIKLQNFISAKGDRASVGAERPHHHQRRVDHLQLKLVGIIGHSQRRRRRRHSGVQPRGVVPRGDPRPPEQGRHDVGLRRHLLPDEWIRQARCRHTGCDIKFECVGCIMIDSDTNTVTRSEVV